MKEVPGDELCEHRLSGSSVFNKLQEEQRFKEYTNPKGA